MAGVPISQYPGDTPAQYSDALDHLAAMANGNDHINTHPGLMQALVDGKATAQDAQALNQYMAGVKAQNMMTLASATGAKITFNDDERNALNAMGVDYSHVDASQQQLADAGNLNGLGAAGGASSSAATPAPQAPKKNTGFWDKGILHGLSRTGYDVLHNPVTNVINEGYNVASSAVAGAADDITSAEQHLGIQGYDPNDPGASTRKYGAATHPQRAEQMKALGYDPDSVWSNLAFDAHGYAKTDVSPAIDAWNQADGKSKYGIDGDQAMVIALQFSKDPEKFQKELLATATGEPTDPATQKLEMLQSPEFQKLSIQLNAADQTIGNQMATGLGIDPVTHPVLFNSTAAGTNLVASFMIDPTMLAGKVVASVAKAPIAIKSLYDTEKITSLLDPANAGRFGARARVINGWSQMIDSTNKIRTALETGDKVTAAAEYARIQKATPALVDLVPDFLGKSQGAFRQAADDIGIRRSSGLMKNIDGEPVTSLGEASRYIASTGGLTRLAVGKAAVESSYMPGAVSSWGFRAVKANLAAHAAARDTARTVEQESVFLAARNAGKLSEEDQAVYDAAKTAADPGVASHPTIDLDRIRRFLPEANDGVDAKTGMIVASPDAALVGQHVDDLIALERKANLARGASTQATNRAQKATDNEDLFGFKKAVASRDNALARHQDLLSQISAKKDELSLALKEAGENAPRSTPADYPDQLLAAERGKVAYNMRRYGKPVAPDGLGAGGWASPTAIASRARLARARFTNLLPINNAMDLTDAATANKVRQYARFYLGKGAANDLATQFAGGDLGTRKVIVQGLFDQVAHAAGLSRTDVGREMLRRIKEETETYTHVGAGWAPDGKQIALHQGQTTTTIALPSFTQLQKASNRVGLYEATVGRVGTSTAADHLFNLFRIGVLMRPATATRNIIEPYAKAALDGQLGMVARARALTYMSNEELARLGEKLGVDINTSTPEYITQIAEKNLAEKLENGTKHQVAVAKHMLKRVQKGDLAAMAGYGRTRVGSAMSDTFAHVAKFYHQQLGVAIPAKEAPFIEELNDVLPQAAHNFGQQVVADTFDPLASNSIRDVAQTGLNAVPIKYDLSSGTHPLTEALSQEGSQSLTKRFTRTGFAHESTDTSVGEARYINALATRTYNQPETAKAVIEALRKNDGDLSAVKAALEKENRRGTAFGNYYKVDETSPQAFKAVTPEQVELGKTQWARDVVNDFRYMLTKEDGTLNDQIAEYIGKTGKSPDEVWFAKNLAKGDLPKTVLAPQYAAAPVGGMSHLAMALQDITGKAFNQIVEGSIKRNSSMPALAAHYLKERAAQADADLEGQMVRAGLSEESAKQLAMGQAIKSSYVRTAQMIDDPGQKTQFDIVARNMLMFPRAMQAFVRRWGGSLAADPFKARKMMLSLEASEHSGIVYRDQNGELTFTYPGSAVMRDAMAAVGRIPGFENFAKFPVGMDMTGKLLMAAPGFDNPLRFSLSPMVNIPMREVFKLMPEHQAVWTEIDSALNGEVGASQANQPILSSVMPSALNKLLAAKNEDEKNSIFASAVVGAIAHLSAAGLAPGPDASPAEQDKFLNQVKAQVRNQLYLRFAFGLVAPAAPSNLNENIDNADAAPGGSGTAADYSFHVNGIRNLGAEYKQILDGTGGDVARASAIFTALHPEGLAYTVSTTGTAVNKAYLPATQESLKWMEGNLGFLNKYKSVGAYFMPKENGDFDSNAYQAQLALGLRQKKSISQFYNDVQINQASQTYYNEYDQYNAMKAEALASGDKGRQKLLSSTWTQWKADFLNHNPALKGKFADTTAMKVDAEGQLADLTKMVKDGDAPDGLGTQIDEMTGIFQQYLTWKQQVPSSSLGDAQKQAMADAIDQKLGHIASSDPRLTNLYNAVFRAVDPSLTKVGS